MGGMERRIVSFGPFEADIEAGELRRQGARVPLQQQPFRLLQALVERAGGVVTRDELRRTLWSDGTFVSFERGLTSAMRKVREALGDTAASPVYIETLKGRGYRFIAPVVVRRGAPPRPGAAGAARRPLAWTAAVVLLAAAAGGRAPQPITASARVEAARALSSYACALKSQGRFDDALAVIQRAHALAPGWARITAEVGFYMHAAGRFDGEFPMLRMAIEQDGRSPDAWLHLGLAHARRREFGDAAAALERARALASGDPRVERWLSWVREQQRARA
jgi:DNA-binding winged helix-turn-helix (wHTH) protein